MQQYVIRRILISIPVFIGITIIMFFLINSAPGDPLAAILNPETMDMMDPDQLERMRHQLGLDRPVPYRYMLWFREILKGNLGQSYITGRPVVEAIVERLPATLELMIAALGLSILIGVPLGMLSAIRQYSILDYMLTVGSFFGVSVPIFFLGLLLIYIFSLRVDLFPTSGIQTAGEPFRIGDNLWHLVLPAPAIAVTNIAQFMRYSRSSMLEVIRQDYITTARAKGLAERLVLVRHAFRNALLPIVTLVGLTLPAIFGGAVITETIFQWPGVGTLYVHSVISRDYNIVMGISFFSALLILVSNLLTDITYASVDPRIRYE
jgi:peptide/nickel transport system permease protein